MDDGRKHQRCSVHWRSAISIVGPDGGPQTLQCKTNDVSAGGVSVICPLNIFPDRELTVYLLIDPGGPAHPQVVFEARGKVMNTVLSSKQGGFRLGIQFTKFAGDSKQLLTKNLPKDLVKPKGLVTGASPAPAVAMAAAAAPVTESTPAPAKSEVAAAGEVALPAEGAQGEAEPPTTNEAPPEGETPSAA